MKKIVSYGVRDASGREYSARVLIDTSKISEEEALKKLQENVEKARKAL